MHLVFCLGGLPPLPLDLGRAGGVAVPLGYCLGCAGGLPLLLLLRERAKWGLPARCRLSVFRASDFVVSPNSHRMFHDVRIRGRLRSLASAYYPPVVLVLRIAKHGRIRGPGHVGVARGCRCGCRSRSSSRSRSRGRGRRLQLSSSWLSSRAGCGRGLLTAAARGVGALGLDPWIDTGHTMTACGVTGGGLFTAPGRVISVRVFPARWRDRRNR